MKIFILTALVIEGLLAATPTAPTLYGPLYWECVISNEISTDRNTEGWSSTAKDSLVGVDSIFLVKNYRLDPGYSYVAQLVDSVNADTVKIFSNTYDAGHNGSRILLQSSSVDSIKSDLSKTTQQIQLQTGLTVFGTRLDLIAYSYRATLKRLIKSFKLYRVKSALVK
jgi:hypothetical protein